MKHKFFKSLLTVSCIIHLSFQVATTEPQHIDIQSSQQLLDIVSADPNLTKGIMENGLHYYIRKNNLPKGHASLQLVVNIGSNVEKDNERGLAHFIEHLAFKSTKHFPNPTETIAFFAAHGVSFGPDLNAYTSQEETSYLLSLPNSEELLDKGIRWLSDCAGFISITQEAVDSERAIILDEMQARNTANYRLYAKLAQLIGKGSPYEDHFPIGTAEIIKHASIDTITQFYTTWYRPEVMAVIAVGDFNPTTIETLIKKYFGELSASHPKQRLHLPEINPNPIKKGVFIHDDKEVTHPTCSLLTTHPTKPIATIESLKEFVLGSILSYCLNLRLQEQITKPTSNLLSCFYYENQIFRMLKAYGIQGVLKNETSLTGIQELVTVAKQAVDHGFTEQEVTAAQQAILANLDATLANLDLLNHQLWCQNYHAHFTKQDQSALVKQDQIIALQKSLTQNITLVDINDYAVKVMPLHDCLTIYTINSNQLQATTADTYISQISNNLKNTISTQTTPYQDTTKKLILDQYPSTQTTGNTLITPLPVINAHKITLGNGITIYTKKTEFEKDNVYILAQRPKGLISHGKEINTAATAPLFIGTAGFAGLKPHEITQQLSDKQHLFIQESIENHWSTLLASCINKDIAFILQLLLTKINQPNNDAAALDLLKNQLHQQVTNKALNPQILYQEFLTEQIYQHDYLFKPLTHSTIDTFTSDSLITAYNQYFKQLNQFTFCIVGDFEFETLLPLLENTLGKLDHKTENTSFQAPVSVAFVETKEEIFSKKSAEQCQTTITFPFSMIPNKKNNFMLYGYTEIIQDRLFEKLRFQNSKVYSPHVYAINLNNFNENTIDDTFRLSIAISCDKDAVSTVINLTLEELKAINQQGITSNDFERAKKKIINHLHEQSQSNFFWLNHILTIALVHHETFESQEEIKTRINNLSLDEFNTFAQKLIATDRYYTLSLLPEDK